MGIKVGEIEFLDTHVPIYQDPTLDTILVSWGIRNPDSEYRGIVYLDPVLGIKYPEGAIIPKQTESDREKLPKFIIIGNNYPLDYTNLRSLLWDRYKKSNPPHMWRDHQINKIFD
jgi:hypothetical protein